MTLVITTLIGGLGNQLFQYAAGRALADRAGVPLKLDVSGFESYALRRYELGTLPIAASLATPDDLAPFGPTAAGQSRLRRLLVGAVASRQAAATHTEPHFHYDAGFETLAAPLRLNGYWQSERYFERLRPQLLAELRPVTPLEPENLETARSIDGATAVSVHVRRGDYVSNSTTNAFHGTCSPGYYRAATAAIAARVSAPHFFVFSDDQAWTQANVTLEGPTTYVSANPPDRGFRDMQLMSRCQHHVIANSSFSWWGAWLNPSPDKIVVAPQRWFAAGANDTRDLLPAGWIRL